MEKGKYYEIAIEVNGKILNYTCKILDIDETFITFRDKFDSVFSFNKKFILYAKKLSDGGEK